MTKFGWPVNYNKPEGCCRINRQKEDLSLLQGGVELCRMSKDDAFSEMYYFEGCLTKWKKIIPDSKSGIIVFTVSVMALMV